MTEKNSFTPRKAVVVHSPHSGNSARLEQALAALREGDCEIVDLLPISDLSDATEQGERWKSAGIDCVIAAGGDGLIGGIAAPVIASGLPLGILPLGTANDIARSIAIPIDPRLAAQMILTGTPGAIDVGLASSLEPDSSPDNFHASISKRMYFAHALTLGLNVQFARLATDTAIRQRFGSMTYPFAVVEALRTYKPIEVELRFNGLVARKPSLEIDQKIPAPPAVQHEPMVLRCKAAQVTAVNAPVFWGPLQAQVPGVDLTDRLLDIVVVEDASADQLLWRITHFFSHEKHTPPTDLHGWHAQHPTLFAAGLTDVLGIHHVQTHSITITTPTGSQEVTIDGEIAGQTPVHAQPALERLRLIVPSDSPLTSLTSH
jgi:diacylglycerol kinase (ATP)